MTNLELQALKSANEADKISQLSGPKMHEALEKETNFTPSKKRHDFQNIPPAFNFVSEHNLLNKDFNGEGKVRDSVQNTELRF